MRRPANKKPVIQKVDLATVLEIVRLRGYTRDPRVRSMNDILAEKIKKIEKHAQRRRKARRAS